MASKKKSAKTTKPKPVDVKEPVAAEESVVHVEEPVEPIPAEESPVDVQEPQEPEAVVPGTQDPVEPVEAGAVPQVPKDLPEPEATTPEDPSEPEPAPVDASPFTTATRDPRLPEIGAVITRQYKGTVIEVTVLEAGFEFAGETYSSISKVAAAVSGARAVNGFAFFRLGTIPGGKSPRTGAGTTRLARKINKIESLVAKLRVAVEAGQTALADAGEELEKMKGVVGQEGQEGE